MEKTATDTSHSLFELWKVIMSPQTQLFGTIASFCSKLGLSRTGFLLLCPGRANPITNHKAVSQCPSPSLQVSFPFFSCSVFTCTSTISLPTFSHSILIFLYLRPTGIVSRFIPLIPLLHWSLQGCNPWWSTAVCLLPHRNRLHCCCFFNQFFAIISQGRH